MQDLSCRSYDCNNAVRVSTDVESVICSTCLLQFSAKMTKAEQEKIDELKSTATNVPVFKRKRWTKEEDQVIYDKVQVCTIKELMELLPSLLSTE